MSSPAWARTCSDPSLNEAIRLTRQRVNHDARLLDGYDLEIAHYGKLVRGAKRVAIGSTVAGVASLTASIYISLPFLRVILRNPHFLRIGAVSTNPKMMLSEAGAWLAFFDLSAMTDTVDRMSRQSADPEFPALTRAFFPNQFELNLESAEPKTILAHVKSIFATTDLVIDLYGTRISRSLEAIEKNDTAIDAGWSEKRYVSTQLKWAEAKKAIFEAEFNYAMQLVEDLRDFCESRNHND